MKVFPFISDDNVLYFFLKGLAGFGGYDISSVDLNKVINLIILVTS
jgi:hypothetical protein